MSGKQAKAKRKSAKKAAATPAPASARLRTDFIIENVRCFAGEQRVPIRPITLLVGENSTGKTTFLGCYQRFVDMLSFPPVSIPDGEFSRPPFLMGGFLDIARNVGNGKAKPREFRVGGIVVRPTGSPLSLVYSFGEKSGEASDFRLILGFPDGDELSVSKGEIIGQNAIGWLLMKTTFAGPGFRCPVIGSADRSNDLSYDHVMDTVRYGISRSKFPSDSEMKGKRRSFPARLAALIKEWRDNHSKMRDFVVEKFRLGSGADNIVDFIVNENVHFTLGECVAVAPVRPMPQRSYDSIVAGNPEERFLAKLSRMARVNPKKWEELRGRLTDFGAGSGMFSQLEMISHGKGADAPFSLRVNARGVDANIADVGYGVSQLLPFLGQVAKASLEKRRKHFLFQQPEDHLHPRAQAAFASFIADSAKKDGHTFLVETHSDFIVNRVGVHVAKGDIDPDDVALLYFEPQKSGGAVKIHRIELNRNGEPISPPKGYRDFFLHETERVLGLRKD